VYLLGSKLGTVTNEKGFFKIKPFTFPDTLKVSYIGYKTIYLPYIKQDTNITIYLYQESAILDEIVIKSKPNIYNNNYTILDYDFIDSNIIVLQEKKGLLKNNTSLILLNEKFDTIKYNNNLPKRAYKLYKDCLDNIHLLTRDSAYQIALYNEKITLFSPIEIRKFYKILSDCLFKVKQNLFFRQNLYNGFKERIFYINEESHKKYVFLDSFDTIHFKSFKMDMRDISSRYWGYSIPIASIENDSLLLSNIHKYDRKSRFLIEFSDKPIQNQIFNHKDIVIYFNNVSKKIQIFLPNGEQQNIEMFYKNHKNFPPKIFYDKIKSKFYAIYKNNNYYIFYRIDLFNKNLKYCSKLPRYFTSEFKINNDYVYFLSNKILTNTQNKKLSRLYLLCK